VVTFLSLTLPLSSASSAPDCRKALDEFQATEVNLRSIANGQWNSKDIVSRLVELSETRPKGVDRQVWHRYSAFLSKVFLLFSGGPIADLIEIPPDPLKEEKILVGILEKRGLTFDEVASDDQVLMSSLEYVAMYHPSQAIRKRVRKIFETYEYLLYLGGKFSLPRNLFVEQATSLHHRTSYFVSELTEPVSQQRWRQEMDTEVLPEIFYQWVLGDLSLLREKMKFTSDRLPLDVAIKNLRAIWMEVHQRELTPAYNPITSLVVSTPAYEFYMR